MITDWQFYAFAAPAVILVGLGKGGFSGLGLLSFPLMALVAPPIQAAAIILPILMLQDLIGVWAFRREYSRENLKMLIPGALVGLFVGYLFARTVPDAAILLLVGVISTLFVIFTFVGARRGQVDPPTPNGWSATLWGGSAGSPASSPTRAGRRCRFISCHRNCRQGSTLARRRCFSPS
jgi:uncharacterized membrane protein YfcA